MVNVFAGIWAIAHFAFVEHLILERKFKNNMLAMVRFIDGMLIAWKKYWKEFVLCLN